MKVVLNNIGKKFNKEWIFRGVSQELLGANCYALLGSNGSGKSTLIKIISGHLSPSKGNIEYSNQDVSIKREEIYSEISMAAPYLELPEELKLKELLQYHFQLKKPIQDLSLDEMLEIMCLKDRENEFISNFSSGIKQRLKLGIAFLSKGDILLLDEPTTNLDDIGVEWYLTMIEKYKLNRLVVIGSNQKREYAFCDEFIQVEDYKEKHKLAIK